MTSRSCFTPDVRNSRRIDFLEEHKVINFIFEFEIEDESKEKKKYTFDPVELTVGPLPL